MAFLITRFFCLFLVCTSLFAVAVPASAANVLMVREKVAFNKTADEVWKRIGDFCAIADWHPAVANCVVEGETRILTLVDGGAIEEARTDASAMSYKYTISSGPLPVDHYKASFKIKDKKDGTSMLIWSASFSPKGASEDEAKAVVQGIFDAGIKGMQELFM
ncbi:MAG: SRPBCC family protein [Granulosicoccus sp.]